MRILSRVDRQAEVIRSRTNSVLKRARNVGRGKEPGFVLVEGERLIRDAIQAGHLPEILLAAEGQAEAYQDLGGACELRICADALLDGLGAVKTAPGLAGVFREPKALSLDGLAERLGLKGQPAGSAVASTGATTLLLGVAGVADPGNLGALVRVAEAAGAAGVIVAPGGARPYGPKALRGSMGSLFRLPVALPGTLGDAVAQLDSLGFQQCVGATRGGAPMAEHPFPARTVIWMTSETGVVPPELENCTGITIPMAGSVESLNVTVAGALLLYAASSGASQGAQA